MAKWNVRNFVRPHVLSLTPYSSARSEYSGEQGIFLDANENPLGSATEESFNRYPDPLQKNLKKSLATFRGVRSEQIFLGNGSDEAIDLLMRAFCEPKQDHILIMPPTYGMYQVSASINQVSVRSVALLPDYQIDMDKVVSALVPGCKLIFICSPNNPTGNLIHPEEIHSILSIQEYGLVVVDEAYIDFSESEGFLPFLDQYPNLVVLQTFSKAWGLAGLRLGAAFAHPEVIDILNRIKPPYNLNAYTQQKGIQALQNIPKMQEMIQTILQQRQKLEYHLARHPLVEKIYPTDANFILVKIRDAEKIYQMLLEKLIIVRSRTKVTLCEGCLRISVGTEEENNSLLTALESLDYEKKNPVSR